MTGPTPINTGACQPWTDTTSILNCCDADFNTDVDLTGAAQLASDLLYELSGHRFPGICEATVRPCASNVSCWHPWNESWYAGRDCSCQPLSKIKLAGYPAREIVEVSIDGELIDPAEYRLDRNLWLVRLADADGNPQRWPACQRMDVDQGIGTFFVLYDYGLEPPLAGAAAATQLACQIARACPGGGLEDDCELPAGTVRVTRQGLTIDASQLGLWLIGSLRTGMPLVDAFISVYGKPRTRRTALAVPELLPYPLRVG